MYSAGRRRRRHLDRSRSPIPPSICPDTYHNEREDQADEEEAEPVHRPCDHVGGRPGCLSEELSGQDVGHSTCMEGGRA